jgi:hypothetical protein
MLRQVGLAVGVAILIAVLGAQRSPAATVEAFQRGWWVAAAIAMAGGLTAIAVLGLRRAPGVSRRPAAPGEPTVAAPRGAPPAQRSR